MALAEQGTQRRREDARGARIAEDAHGRAAADGDALVVETVRRHADTAMRIARRYTDTADDALEAYQRAVVQLGRHRERLRPATVHAWFFEVVRRECLAVREQRRRLVPMADHTLHALLVDAAPSAEDRAVDRDTTARAAEALGALKPDEARALTLQAAGLSYADIAERLDWTRTKTNRALTEGRRAFRLALAELESGRACLRWAPVIAGRREARPADRARLLVHLRNCPGCRATARALHDTSSVLAAVLPVGLAAAPAAGGEGRLGRVPDALARWADAVSGALTDRAVGAALKLHTVAEAATAAKIAAVTASAVVVAAGGAVVEQASERDATRPALRAIATATSTPVTARPGGGAVPDHDAATRAAHAPPRPRSAVVSGRAAGRTRREFGAPAPGRREHSVAVGEFAAAPGAAPARSFEGGRATPAAREFAGARADAHAAATSSEFGG